MTGLEPEMVLRKGDQHNCIKNQRKKVLGMVRASGVLWTVAARMKDL